MKEYRVAVELQRLGTRIGVCRFVQNPHLLETLILRQQLSCLRHTGIVQTIHCLLMGSVSVSAILAGPC